MKSTFTLVALLLAGGVGKAVEVPQLLSPPDGMEITDVATYFQWLPVAGVTNFEFEVARDRDFHNVVNTKKTTNTGYHKNLYFPKDVLPAGNFFWRVRSFRNGQNSPWSKVRSFSVNTRHPVLPQVVRKIDPEHPLFLMRNRAWDPTKYSEHVQDIIPPGLEHIIAVDDIALAGPSVFERAMKYQELGVDFVVWNNRAQVSLATIEFLFQNYSHCVGTAEGEHFWGWEWEHGPERNLSEQDFVRRAWLLCAKYGRFYFEGEGEAARYQWTTISYDCRQDYRKFHRNIVPMFKSTVGNVALHSIGAVEGLIAAGYADNCGFWADEFVWGECGFGRIGELNQIPHESLKKFGTRQCPWTYDIQMWLIGIASGSTVFQLESAHQWNADGSGAGNYSRYFLPFVSAVVKHKLIPSRRAFLDSLKIAVACDYETAKRKHESNFTPEFGFLNDLYALKHKPFQELIPDNSRYGIVCLLPPGTTNMAGPTHILNQRDLPESQRTIALFNASYPQRFSGDAFMWECDGTVVVTDSNENQDIPQKFTMPVQSGLLRSLEGTIGVHEYLVGKISADGFWFQTNCEYSERDLQISLTCSRKPEVTIVPSSAATRNEWVDATKTLSLRLSHTPGAVEVILK